MELRRLVVVEPQELGDELHTRRAMIRRLLKDFDAERCSEEHGFHVTVTTLEDVSPGKIRSGTGSVIFWVTFKCIVFRPIRNEILEAEVTDVLERGFLAACGASRIFVPRKEMDGFEFRPGASLEYNEWHDSSGSVIKPKSMARLKVVGTRWEPKERTIMAAGTLNGDLLGRVFEEGDPTFDNGFAI